MLKKIFLLTIIIICSHSLFSLEHSTRWNVIWEQDKRLEIYEKDSLAEAVILYDMGNIEFFEIKKDNDKDNIDNDYSIRLHRSKRIKILKDAGVKYAEITIPFKVNENGKSELVSKIEAITYNIVDGEVVETHLNKKSIIEEHITPYKSVFKFIFPNVKKGSIIEYRYILESPFIFNLPEWRFQDKIPTVLSQYVVQMTPFYKYSLIPQGIDKFDIKKAEEGRHNRMHGNVVKSFGQNVGDGIEFKDIIYTYALKHTPAFKDESYITSISDYIMKIEFQLANIYFSSGYHKDIIITWTKLIKEFLNNKYFGKYVKRSMRVSKEVLENEIQAEGKLGFTLAKEIIDHIKYSYNWNGEYKKYASKSPKEFEIQKTGNSADINLYLVGMLREAGIEAFPVLVSTRDHGLVKTNYPYTHFFNHVIALVRINNEFFLTDATENQIAFNRLPPISINFRGLAIDPNKEQWVELYLNPLSYDLKTLNLKIDIESECIEAETYIQSTEYEAYNYRKEYNDDTNKLQSLFAKGGLKSIDTIESKNFRNLSLPYILIAKGKSELNKLDNQYAIYPFLNFPISENKLTQKERLYPVDLIYSRAKSFHSVIQLPDDYEISRLPTNYKIDNELLKIEIEYTPSTTGLEVVANYELKKAVYYAFEYKRLKYYYDIIIKKLNEAVTIKKRSHEITD